MQSPPRSHVLSSKVPGFCCCHDQGKDIYLGQFGSPESRQKYDRLIQEWLASGRVMTSEDPVDEQAFSMAELIVAYMPHAKVNYQKDGKPTSHLHNVEDAMTYLKDLYGLEAVKDFGHLKLKAVRQTMISKCLGRTTINKYTGNLKRMFKWGTENELVPPAVFHGLQAVGGLRKGRCEAKEYGPVKPVPEPFVAAIKDHVSAQVWAMIELQMFTGMRPGEVVLMRGNPAPFDNSLQAILVRVAPDADRPARTVRFHNPAWIKFLQEVWRTAGVEHLVGSGSMAKQAAAGQHGEADAPDQNTGILVPQLSGEFKPAIAIAVDHANIEQFFLPAQT